VDGFLYRFETIHSLRYLWLNRAGRRDVPRRVRDARCWLQPGGQKSVHADGWAAVEAA